MTKRKTVDKKTRVPRGSKEETDFLVLLDESGSMQLCKDETISNFNEQVQAIKKAARGQKVRVSLSTFHTPGEQKEILWRQDVKEIKPLTAKSYQPDGSTAMYDAIVSNLDKLSKELGEPRKPPARSTSKPNPCTMVVIVSDGQENSSKARREDVAERIQALQKTNRWTFTYMGANQDLAQVSKDLHIPRGNTLDYLGSKRGTRAAGQVVAHAVQSYTTARSVGMTSSKNMFGSGDQVTRVRENDTAKSMAGQPRWKRRRGGN
jgi:hypothetical protein